MTNGLCSAITNYNEKGMISWKNKVIKILQSCFYGDCLQIIRDNLR